MLTHPNQHAQTYTYTNVHLHPQTHPQTHHTHLTPTPTHPPNTHLKEKRVSLKTAGPHSGAPSFREGPARLLQAIEQDTGQNIRGVRTLLNAQDTGQNIRGVRTLSNAQDKVRTYEG